MPTDLCTCFDSFFLVEFWYRGDLAQVQNSHPYFHVIPLTKGWQKKLDFDDWIEYHTLVVVLPVEELCNGNAEELSEHLRLLCSACNAVRYGFWYLFDENQSEFGGRKRSHSHIGAWPGRTYSGARCLDGVRGSLPWCRPCRCRRWPLLWTSKIEMAKATTWITYAFWFMSEQTTTTFNSIFNHNKNVNKCNPVSSTASTNDDLSGSFECSHIWKHWKISRGIEDKNLGSRILAVR